MDAAETKAKALISELQNWCREKYGRNTQAAEALGVSRQLISDWFSGRTVPSLVMGFKIQEFLERQQPDRRTRRRLT
jgi:transcriptional regulator with XRE-family HTH domain